MCSSDRFFIGHTKGCLILGCQQLAKSAGEEVFFCFCFCILLFYYYFLRANVEPYHQDILNGNAEGQLAHPECEYSNRFREISCIKVGSVAPLLEDWLTGETESCSLLCTSWLVTLGKSLNFSETWFIQGFTRPKKASTHGYREDRKYM